MTAVGACRVLYVAGPMTGLPDYNRPAFREATRLLELNGFTVLSPERDHGIPADQQQTAEWEDWMRADLRLVTRADGLALLDGWTRSRGAQLEVTVAQGLGISCLPVNDWAAIAAARTLAHRRSESPLMTSGGFVRLYLGDAVAATTED